MNEFAETFHEELKGAVKAMEGDNRSYQSMVLESIYDYEEGEFPSFAMDEYIEAFGKEPETNMEKAAFMLACEELGYLD